MIHYQSFCRDLPSFALTVYLLWSLQVFEFWMIVSCFSLLAYHVWENTQSTRLLQLSRHFSQWVFPVPLQPIPLKQSQSGHRNEGFQTETKTFTTIWSHSHSLTDSCCIIFHFWWTIANYSPFSTKSPLYWHVQLLIHTVKPTKTWRVNCRLREMVSYESRTVGELVWGEVRTQLPFGDSENLLHAIFGVTIYVNQHVCCF